MHKDTARISKELFSKVIVGWEVRRDLHSGNHDCPYDRENHPHLSDQRLQELCQEHCSVYDSIHLSRTEILQWVSFHFLNISSRGIAKNVDIRNIADFIGCDIRTVMKNMRSLQKKELIAFARLDTYIFNIAILGYDQYVSRETGEFTGGYLKMNISHFEACRDLSCLNTLKLTLQLYLTYDNHEIRRLHRADGIENGKPVTRTRLDRVTMVLPAYIAKSVENIEQLLKDQEHILLATIETEQHIDGNIMKTVHYIRMELADPYNGKKTEEARKQQLLTDIAQKSEALSLPIHKISDIHDLLSVAMDLGKEPVMAAMEDWSREIALHQKTGHVEPVSNIGGYIRTKAVRNGAIDWSAV